MKSDDYAQQLAQMTSILVTAGEFETARQAFDVSPKDNTWYWGSGLGVPDRYSEGLAYAMTGPAREDVAEIHQFLRDPHEKSPTVSEVEDVQRQLERCRARDTADKAVQYFDLAAKMLGQMHTYAAGDWVDLTFEKGMPLWLCRLYNIEFIDERTAKVFGEQSANPIELRPITRFAPPFIVEAEVKPVSALYGAIRTGITIGAGEVKGRAQRPAPQSVVAGETIYACIGSRTLRGLPDNFMFSPDPLPEDGFLHLALRRYEGEIQFFAMHSRMGREADKEEPMTDFVTFGDIGRGNATKEAVFRNLRIRRIPSKSETGNPESSGSLLSLQQDVDFYPECPDARIRLASGLMIEGRPEDALEHLDIARKVYPKIRDMNRIRGCALCAIGSDKEAHDAFTKELQYFPEILWTRINLAWLLATTRDDSLRKGPLANSHITGLDALPPDQQQSWSFLLTQAVVRAELGDFTEAKRLASEAAEAANTNRRKEFVARVRKELDEGRPYRMPAGGELPPQPAVRAKPKESTAPGTAAATDLRTRPLL